VDYKLSIKQKDISNQVQRRLHFNAESTDIGNIKMVKMGGDDCGKVRERCE